MSGISDCLGRNYSVNSYPGRINSPDSEIFNWQRSELKLSRDGPTAVERIWGGCNGTVLSRRNFLPATIIASFVSRIVRLYEFE